jgi:hypothetical protein
LINLGFEWFVQRDENRNATVAVSYRKKGETAWKPALPMLRLKGERVYQNAQMDVISPNMFAGSILDLQPDTAHEAQFVMSDPDGVRGEGRRIVTVRTRPEPQPYEGGRVLHVYARHPRLLRSHDEGKWRSRAGPHLEPIIPFARDGTLFRRSRERWIPSTR